METIRTVGVRELKDNLSAYLREVKSGSRVLVTEHNRVVAELREPLKSALLDGENPAEREWVENGWLHLPTARKAPFPVTGLSFSAGTTSELIDADRGTLDKT